MSFKRACVTASFRRKCSGTLFYSIWHWTC